jgi:uncharacterized membrane protein YphA (DoxX/SURF4 family)
MTTTSTMTPAEGWDRRLWHIAVFIGRLGLALLFFTQLFWKAPPNFGCGESGNFAYATEDANGQLTRGAGLCDWLGIESIFAQLDFDNDGSTDASLRPTPLIRLNGAFVDNVVIPNINVFGWLIWLSEALIVVTMLFGLLTRLGALISLGVSLQLMLGLAGVWDPVADLQEWEWTYHTIVLLSIVMLGLAPGRFWGLDARLRPRLKSAADGGSRLARVLFALT